MNPATLPCRRENTAATRDVLIRERIAVLGQLYTFGRPGRYDLITGGALADDATLDMTASFLYVENGEAYS
jgi:hypothetical protein